MDDSLITVAAHDLAARGQDARAEEGSKLW
jgi:hypothetical protein